MFLRDDGSGYQTTRPGPCRAIAAVGLGLTLTLTSCTSSKPVPLAATGSDVATTSPAIQPAAGSTPIAASTSPAVQPPTGSTSETANSPSITQPTAGAASEDGTFGIGTAATDTFGGWIADDEPIAPSAVTNPAISRLDPLLRRAIQDAADSATADGIDIMLTSGWRSRGFQQRLFDDAVRTYGSVDVAKQYVAPPDESMHVVGKAVDVAPLAADQWLIANGSRFGLCQIYANEPWHFELATYQNGNCPTLKANAAG